MARPAAMTTSTTNTLDHEVSLTCAGYDLVHDIAASDDKQHVLSSLFRRSDGHWPRQQARVDC
jgi:hypothetical protein